MVNIILYYDFKWRYFEVYIFGFYELIIIILSIHVNFLIDFLLYITILYTNTVITYYLLISFMIFILYIFTKIFDLYFC